MAAGDDGLIEHTVQREELLRTWFVLKDAGHHPGRTDDRLSDCVRRALGPNECYGANLPHNTGRQGEAR